MRKYNIEVAVMNSKERNAMIRDLVSIIRHYHVLKADESDDKRKIRDASKESDRCMKVLKKIFADDRYLKPATFSRSTQGEKTIDRITKNLSGKVEAADWLKSHVGSLSTNSKTQCQSWASGEAMDSRLKPFIKVVKIFLEAGILDNGIVLVDIPGSCDTDYGRAKAAKHYQETCDSLILVAGIDRIVDSQRVRDTICDIRGVRGALTSNTQNIIVVATKSSICTVPELKSELKGKYDEVELKKIEMELKELIKKDPRSLERNIANERSVHIRYDILTHLC